MLRALQLRVTVRPKLTLVLVAVVALLAGALDAGAAGVLRNGGYDDPHAASVRARVVLAEQFHLEVPTLYFVVAGPGGADAPAVTAVGRAVTAELEAQHGPQVTSYFTTHTGALRATDGSSALVSVGVPGVEEVAYNQARPLIDKLQRRSGPVTVVAGGPLAVDRNVTASVTTDLAKAESIAIPLTLLLLLAVFGSAVAAALPLLIGLLAILGSFAVLFVLGSLTQVSIFALNMTTAMGLGLAVDYSLLMVSRFREELAAGQEVPEAVARTVRSAGRTIVFSSATVAVALAALLVFPLYFLRSFAYAGVATTILTMLATLVTLPPLLLLLGHNVDRWSWRRRPTRAASPWWGRLAATVMRRPALAALPVTALLLLFASPFLHARFGLPDDRVLPRTETSRQAGDLVRAHYATSDTTTLTAVLAPQPAAALTSYARAVSAVHGVAFVIGPTGTFHAGTQVGPGDPTRTLPGGSRITIATTVEPVSTAGTTLVRAVRAVEPRALVTGIAPAVVDSVSAIAARLPLAGTLIVLTTLVLLFLFTGSLVLPVKALLMNALTLGAVMGSAVWVFQDGHLSGALGFTAAPMSTAMPLLLFCVAFGLSMDYEVFLLARIVEAYHATGDTRAAVIDGLARTGRIVSAAAALLAVTFLAIGTGEVAFMKLFGFGTGLAILVDSTAVRGVLVPAFMRVAGRANWWAPPPLRRLHARIGLSETSTAPARSDRDPRAGRLQPSPVPHARLNPSPEDLSNV